MEHGVVVPVVIPDDVQEKIKGLDVASISDEIDLEADFSALTKSVKATAEENDMDDFAL
jgi:hypothetical protein